MATITLTIPTTTLDRVLAGVAKQMNVITTGFDATQKAALVKSYFKQVTVDAVRAVELGPAADAARAAQDADIATNVTSQIT